MLAFRCSGFECRLWPILVKQLFYFSLCRLFSSCELKCMITAPKIETMLSMASAMRMNRTKGAMEQWLKCKITWNVLSSGTPFSVSVI